jgi:hypothetical protein
VPPGINRFGVKNFSAPPGAHLNYYGGRVVSNMQVVIVLWGSGSYESHVTSTSTPSMLTFYQQILGNGSYSAWLNREYNTVGQATNQIIGPGGVVAQSPITITPSVTSSTISDAQIQAELAKQIQAGTLPAPTRDAAGNNNTYYAIFFPHGKTITLGGSNSCQNGGFCAYHGTAAAVGHEIYYGVHPDMQAGSGCDTGCGNAATAFGNYTSVASHEMTETITDAEVGNASVLGPPLAWYDPTNGEIGDICNALQGSYAALDGQTYTIQFEFSNAQNNCINIPPGFTLAVHDSNHDGKSDIAWRDTSGNTAIWLMNGIAVTNQSTSFIANVPNQWAIVGQRDFNGDGKGDLLWHDTSGNVAIWEMNGTTVLNPNSSFVANVPTQWSILGTGDFNGDGMADILWQDTSGNVAIWEMNGTAILNQNSSLVANVPGQWSIKGTGDFNAVGKTDILWQDNTGNVAIWEMNGTTILNQNSSFVTNVPSQWAVKGTGDFNGDGRADILWQDTSGNVAIWEMNGTTVLNGNSSFVANVPGQWSIQLTGDYNGDGMSDILWQDTSHNVAIWEMNGTVLLNANNSFVATVSGQWSIQHLSAE